MMLFHCYFIVLRSMLLVKDTLRSKKGKKIVEPEITQAIFMENTKRIELQNPIK